MAEEANKQKKQSNIKSGPAGKTSATQSPLRNLKKPTPIKVFNTDSKPQKQNNSGGRSNG